MFADSYWNTNSGYWTNAANWVTNVPGSGDTAYVGHPSYARIGTCIVDTAGCECSMPIIGSYLNTTGTLKIAGGSLTTMSGSTSLGSQGCGIITQSNGTLNNNGNDFLIGNSAVGEGCYYLSGGVFTNYRELRVGNFGNGTIELSGTGKICGAGRVVYIGMMSGATGTVIQTGGTWDNNGESFNLGFNTGAEGIWRMSGGVLTNFGSMGIGIYTKGTFELSGNGKVYAEYGTFLGQSAIGNSEGFLTQTGGEWNNNNKNFYIGYAAGTEGTYYISGGLLTNVLDFINSNGQGTFKIAGGNARIYVTTYAERNTSTLSVAPDTGGITTIEASGDISLNGAVEFDFLNYDFSGYPRSLVLIKYGGTRTGTFSATNVLTEEWSSDIEYDDDGKQVIAKIKGPAKGLVITVQ